MTRDTASAKHKELLAPDPRPTEFLEHVGESETNEGRLVGAMFLLALLLHLLDGLFEWGLHHRGVHGIRGDDVWLSGRWATATLVALVAAWLVYLAGIIFLWREKRGRVSPLVPVAFLFIAFVILVIGAAGSD